MDKQIFNGSALPENAEEGVLFPEDTVDDEAIGYDRRLDLLSSGTRRAIAAYFRCDIDAASLAAERAFQNQRHPAAWVCEIRAAAKRGWQ